MKPEVFIRISREAKNVIGNSRFATVALEYIERLFEHNRDEFRRLVETASKYLEVVMNDRGRSRLILPRYLRFRTLSLVAGNARLLKALIYYLALDRTRVLHRLKEVKKRAL